jgi:diguanylate cyclase (GGDEF)-like protein/PAS domain S-box-containing protein
VSCVLAIVLLAGMQSLLQNALTDARFRWSARPASGSIVLVAIDSSSIDRMGAWPWPRQYHAALIDKLMRAGATDIVFDVDFSSPSNPEADQAFVEALKRAGGSVVLPAFKQLVQGADGPRIHINRPLPAFDKLSWSAIVNVAVEPDGLVRLYSSGEMFDGQFVPSVGSLLAGRIENREALLRIDFGIRVDSLPTVSFVDVLHGDPVTLAKLKGKKVIIGATAVELGDRFSVADGHVIAGPQLQTLAAESIIQNRVLKPTSSVITFVGIGFIALLMLALWRRAAGLRVALLLAMAIAGELAAAVLQVRYAIILETALWDIAIVAYLAAIALDEIDFRGLLGGVAERRFQRIAMSLGDGLVCTDQDGRITVWNPGAEVIFGYSADEMIGQPLNRVCTHGAGGAVPFSISAWSRIGAPEFTSQVLELTGRRKGGDNFPLEASVSRWEGVDGFQYGAVMRDISDRKREAERMRYLAEHDTLTGLANRHALYQHLNAMLDVARAEKRRIALLVLDLDKFKQVNDTFGHACGDHLLCEVARQLSALVGSGGLVARLSGDEFAIVLAGDAVGARAATLAGNVVQTFRNTPFEVDNRQIRINASLGIAIYPDFGATADELFGNADLALYRAKGAGRGRHVFFERKIRDEVDTRAAMEAALGLAIGRSELELFFQPQVHLKDGTLAGAEALIRWRHPEHGLMSPGDFMPFVHASTISIRIAQWVIETACRQGRAWERAGHQVRLGVNLSPSQMQNGNLAVAVGKVLQETGLSPHLLELEVTEDILLEDDDLVRESFRRIQDLGAHIVFDDFGTGYASLTYLKKFSLDGLKIDKSFVHDLRTDPDDAAIVGCTITLGQMLDLHVIAEGIEDAATADLLKNMGCQEGQGYYFGAPMPAAEFEKKFFDSRATTAKTAASAA